MNTFARIFWMLVLGWPTILLAYIIVSMIVSLVLCVATSRH